MVKQRKVQMLSDRGRKLDPTIVVHHRVLKQAHRYQLAGRLSERLDEMSKDLTTMIEEINDASSSLSKNNKQDDPVRHSYILVPHPFLLFVD